MKVTDYNSIYNDLSSQVYGFSFFEDKYYKFYGVVMVFVLVFSILALTKYPTFIIDQNTTFVDMKKAVLLSLLITFLISIPSYLLFLKYA